MKSKPRLILCLCLCVVTGWTGRTLALHRRGYFSSQGELSRENTTDSVSSPAAAATRTPEQVMQAAAARCTTEALWDLVRTKPLYNCDGEDEAITRELLDREGAQAAGHAENLDDPARREQWTRNLLTALAERDPGEAQAQYLALPGDWATQDFHREIVDKLLMIAAQSSAESLLATVDALAGSDRLKIGDLSSTRVVDFPVNFDFRKALDHLTGVSGGAELAQKYDLADGWEKRSPEAALDWLRLHSEWLDQAKPGSHALDSALQAVASLSPDFQTQKSAVAELLSQCGSDDEKSEFWQSSAGYGGYVSPDWARIAGQLGGGNDYLTTCLKKGQAFEEQDPDWAKVPADLRAAAIKQFLAEWVATDPTPREQKARAHWQASFDKACGK